MIFSIFKSKDKENTYYFLQLCSYDFEEWCPQVYSAIFNSTVKTNRFNKYVNASLCVALLTSQKMNRLPSQCQKQYVVDLHLFGVLYVSAHSQRQKYLKSFKIC